MRGLVEIEGGAKLRRQRHAWNVALDTLAESEDDSLGKPGGSLVLVAVDRTERVANDIHDPLQARVQAVRWHRQVDGHLRDALVHLASGLTWHDLRSRASAV